jgi:hypothetical protein
MRDRPNDDDGAEGVDGDALRVARVERLQVAATVALRLLDPGHPPEAAVSPLGRASPREDPNLVAAPDRPAGQLDGLRPMPLEVQAERPSAGEGPVLVLELGAEHRVLLLRLTDQLREA